MHLPNDRRLPIHHLAACFNTKSTTYKFYWFLSILQAVEAGNTTTIAKHDIFARMIANAWYTVNYYHVSFGKQDQFQLAIQAIRKREQITIDAKYETIHHKLLTTSKIQTIRQLRHFDVNVPHWFLSPWFPKQEKRGIYDASQNSDSRALYALSKDSITIYPLWVEYLQANAGILKDFCYWNLALFLQARNPNVPDIPNKLIKPAQRGKLNNQRKKFWDIVFQELGSIDCIYTGKKLVVDKYAVEHFIPHSFVSHDLIWNLIPADASFNSTKSDKLPRVEKYFDGFFYLQHTAITIILQKAPENKFLEDYLTIFPDLQEITNSSASELKCKFKERIQPLITIASNNGFEYLP